MDDPESFALLHFHSSGRHWQHTDPIHTVTVKYDRKDNLPKTAAHFHNTAENTKRALLGAIKMTQESNKNLTRAQKELLRLHFRLGHISMQHIQWLVRNNKVKTIHHTATLKIKPKDILKCAARLFGKMGKRLVNAATE